VGLTEGLGVASGEGVGLGLGGVGGAGEEAGGAGGGAPHGGTPGDGWLIGWPSLTKCSLTQPLP
jgi:hypothetical protein